MKEFTVKHRQGLVFLLKFIWIFYRSFSYGRCVRGCYLSRTYELNGLTTCPKHEHFMAEKAQYHRGPNRWALTSRNQNEVFSTLAEGLE